MSPAAMEHILTKVVCERPQLVTSGASRHDMAVSRLGFCAVNCLDALGQTMVGYDWILIEHAPTHLLTWN